MSEIRLISLADRKYFDYLKAMVNSAKMNFPEAKMHVYLVGLNDKHGEYLKKINKNLIYTIENVSFSSDAQKRCYCTNRRGVILDELRDKTDDILIWLDADSIIRGPCSEIISMANSCDIGIRFKNKLDLKSTKNAKSSPVGFMAGLIMVGNSEAAKKFTSEYNAMMCHDLWIKIKWTDKQIKNSGKIRREVNKIWMANQDLLYSTYLKMKDQIRFGDLPNTMLDCSFHAKSYIWSVKASTRDNKIFAREYKKFLPK